MKKAFSWLFALAVIVLLSVLIITASPKEKTDQEKLYEIYENIGPEGILDFLRDQWSDHEILEFLLNK